MKKPLVTRYLPPRPEDCLRCVVDLHEGSVTTEVMLRASGGPGPSVAHGAKLLLAELPQDILDALERLKLFAAERAASDFGFERDTVEINTVAPTPRPN